MNPASKILRTVKRRGSFRRFFKIKQAKAKKEALAKVVIKIGRTAAVIHKAPQKTLKNFCRTQ
ncbi:MAG: hypothetical protein LBR83_08190 [Clostridiales bacterium]|jgi:hypothetical protein|nr:hypothetical protein [Clostridiales bacterium]